MKQAWLAVHSLLDSVQYGKKDKCCVEGLRAEEDPAGQRLPLGSQLVVIRSASVISKRPLPLQTRRQR